MCVAIYKEELKEANRMIVLESTMNLMKEVIQCVKEDDPVKSIWKV